ncbi:unnamed protein product [Arabidopsis lyrata]|uniref:uncharacterized protein LOC9330564 n=1 Tax=Arabidopsis lyrata subsp. lyrata TaxID=81972 RepID=UPI000A29E62F|nr:uncharacterized protein LOC9330564 [Arabidopsis lyrata subsp. lyrata]CAH8255667.1 unnamed protein product [Arabidopsis lyrata]|eukprot:XP_020869744.1 uncharacterized protein LOC9330564 [Arabidopsis lyrata subsp. lyrata]
MVFNSATVMAVAEVSTDTWQLIWRVPSSQRINTEQLLDIAVCFPMHQLSRFVLCLWTFMCLPSSDSFYSYTYETLSASSSSDADDDDRLAFDHNNLYNHRDYYSDDDDDDRSISSFDDNYYDHYSHSD